MTERRIVQCRSCGADMVWVVTRKGKKMPLDPKPDPDGGFVYDGDTDDGTPKVRFIPEGPGRALHEGDRYTSHFSTCPNADERRRPR